MYPKSWCPCCLSNGALYSSAEPLSLQCWLTISIYPRLYAVRHEFTERRQPDSFVSKGGNCVMATCLIEVLDYYNLTHKSDFSFSISITMPILKRDHSPPWCLNNLILIIKH